jgi:hypothetical protein
MTIQRTDEQERTASMRTTREISGSQVARTAFIAAAVFTLGSCKVGAALIDLERDAIEKQLLPASVYAALGTSPLGNVTASNILASSADVYIQVVHTEGVTHSSNITVAPCTKIELKVTAQSGGEANLFGLTKGARTVKDVFTKTFT